ncbi:MAG: hypothetical protein HW419_4031 [Deltaproteobacteria bacterium]|nr:hypothetical protein [Deltaproteobacteria bacterium]
MNPIAKTLELQQQGHFLQRPIGFVRKPQAIITQALLVVLSLVALTDANEFNRRFMPREIVATEINMKAAIPVTFQSVGKGYRSGVREPLQIVVRSQAEWTALWRRHSNELNSTPPTVLFDKEIVVGIFLGEKPTGGYDTAIVRAERHNDELVIDYQELKPAPGGMVTQALTQPFHMVRVAAMGAKTVSFRRLS